MLILLIKLGLWEDNKLLIIMVMVIMVTMVMGLKLMLAMSTHGTSRMMIMVVVSITIMSRRCIPCTFITLFTWCGWNRPPITIRAISYTERSIKVDGELPHT